MKLPIKTAQDVVALQPCYDPIDRGYITNDWTGTALDVLKMDNVPPVDRSWVVLREGWIDDRTLRLFAVWCARKALELVGNPDARSVEACSVAEKYANGLATDDELAAAPAAARDDAWAAARVVARGAQVKKLIEMLEENEQ